MGRSVTVNFVGVNRDKGNTKMSKYNLKNGDRVYSTGVFLEYDGDNFVVVKFDSDTFFDGEVVNDIEQKPFTGDDE